MVNFWRIGENMQQATIKAAEQLKNHFAPRGNREGAFLALLTSLVLPILASCSGAVSSPTTPSTVTLTVSPASADIVPGVSTTFTITGGNPAYSAFSSNGAILPVTATVTGSTFSVVANAVNSDTVVDITVRDATNASAIVKATVKAGAPPAPLAVSPPSANLFADVPATFTVSGGRPAYSASSSNSAVLPVASAIVGTTFTVIPKAVIADTAVDITVLDATGTAVAAKATVKPSSLLNQISFTPFSPSGTGCGTNTVCSGGDAQIVVTAIQNGVILRDQKIHFKVFQGDFQLVTPGSGKLVDMIDVSTDQQGTAVARITANVGAATQVATIETTDVMSGLVRRYNFTIVQQVSGAGILSALPSTPVTITGAKGAAGADGSCPVGATVDYYIYGGTPNYTIASPLLGVATVSPSSVVTNGGKFTARVTGCGKVAFIVTDATGRTIETAALEAVQGPKGDAVTTPAALTVTPSALTVACGSSGSVSVTGSGTFSTFYTNGSSSAGAGFTTSPNAGAIPNTVTFSASTGTISSPVLVDFLNGSLTRRVTVTVTGTVAGSCP